MELRPFRALRYSSGTMTQRGLSNLIAPALGDREDLTAVPEAGAAPENIARVIAGAEGGAKTLGSWLAEEILQKERRPALWQYRLSLKEGSAPRVVDLLVGLVRLNESAPQPPGGDSEIAPETRARRLGLLAETKVDLEPSLLLTRAPLGAALATTRKPDFSATDSRGARHDALRIPDFARHVELQGLVKNVEVVVAGGIAAFEAARQFAKSPAAAKLPGARYKLCAILDEEFVKEIKRAPVICSGLFGFSLEDPVY